MNAIEFKKKSENILTSFLDAHSKVEMMKDLVDDLDSDQPKLDAIKEDLEKFRKRLKLPIDYAELGQILEQHFLDEKSDVVVGVIPCGDLFVISRDYREGGKLWAGRRWSDHEECAALFNTAQEARTAAEKAFKVVV